MEVTVLSILGRISRCYRRRGLIRGYGTFREKPIRGVVQYCLPGVVAHYLGQARFSPPWRFRRCSRCPSGLCYHWFTRDSSHDIASQRSHPYSLVLSAARLPSTDQCQAHLRARPGADLYPACKLVAHAGLYRARRHVQDLIESCSGLRGSGNDDDADYDDSFLLFPLSLEVVRLQGSSALPCFRNNRTGFSHSKPVEIL